MASKPQIVSTVELAEILGISDRRIQQLSSETEKVFEKIGRGKYDLVKLVQSFLSYQTEMMREKSAANSLEAEQTRMTKIKADKAEIELLEKMGKIIHIEALEEELGPIFSTLKSRLMSIPQRLAPQIDPTRIPKLQAIIEQPIREALEELSNECSGILSVKQQRANEKSSRRSVKTVKASSETDH